MTPTVNRAAWAFLFLAFGAVSAVDVDNCPDLIAAVEDDKEVAVSITSDITCVSSITVDNNSPVVIYGNQNTLTISATFSVTSSPADGYSLFAVSTGSELQLSGLTIKEASQEDDAVEWPGVRAIYNEGTLTVNGCVFSSLNNRITSTDKNTRGGVIMSKSQSSVSLLRSTFASNLASSQGGAVCASYEEELTVQECDFTGNEASNDEDDDAVGMGGDIYAADDVVLVVTNSTFVNGGADVAGGSIACCGATISASNFRSSQTFVNTASYGGALSIGLPETGGCPNDLKLSESFFTGCGVTGQGKGGAVAIFDTDAEITDVTFAGSYGTAVYFTSSGENQLDMESIQFNENERPNEDYANGDIEQGSALVIENTSGGDVNTGTMNEIYCFGNNPYECELIYEGVSMFYEGEFKCHICSVDGTRYIPGSDDDQNTERAIDEGGSGSDNTSLIVILSIALGAMLVIVGALAVYKFRVRKNARRLMEDMRQDDL